MILTCSSIRLTTHLIRIILTHALTFYARFRALNLFLQKAPPLALRATRRMIKTTFAAIPDRGGLCDVYDTETGEQATCPYRDSDGHRRGRSVLWYQTCCVALLLLMVASCRNDASRTEPVVSDFPERYVIDEGTPPIGAINGYTPLRGDTALAVDNRDEIFLIVSDRRVGMIGAKGVGPCEYQDVTAYSVAGDTLFILDRGLGRLVGYSVRDGACLSEFVDPFLTHFTGVSKAGPWFYFTMSSYSTPLDPETVLLYRLSAAGEFIPLELRKSDLDADLLMMPINTGRLRHIKERDGVIYFLLPLTHKVWSCNVHDGSVSYFDLKHDSADISAHANVPDLAAAAGIVRDIEMELDLFLLDEYIAVGSNIRGKWMRSIYSYAGELKAREEVSGDMVFEESGVVYRTVSQDHESRSFLIEPVESK